MIFSNIHLKLFVTVSFFCALDQFQDTVFSLVSASGCMNLVEVGGILRYIIFGKCMLGASNGVFRPKS